MDRFNFSTNDDAQVSVNGETPLTVILQGTFDNQDKSAEVMFSPVSRNSNLLLRLNISYNFRFQFDGYTLDGQGALISYEKTSPDWITYIVTLTKAALTH
jgi:hypothetical protein